MPDREKVIKGLTELKKYLPSTMWESINDALALLKEQEMPRLRLFNEREYVVKYTGDALQLLPDTMQELVRCKDCKYNDDGECIIKAGWFPVKADWFCADGEKLNDV